METCLASVIISASDAERTVYHSHEIIMARSVLCVIALAYTLVH